jgi:Antibiotic biosynthesis monooxygenase
MTEFHEIVRARVQPEREEEMLRRRPELEAAVRDALPGLIDIKLIRLDDGSYIDYLRWEEREAADGAVEKFADIPAAEEIHGFLSEDLGHYRGEEAVPAAVS